MCIFACFFQEVDVVFEEDVGFLGALRDLRKGAKCPVILTSEFYRQEYAMLSCALLHLPRPRLLEVTDSAYETLPVDYVDSAIPFNCVFFCLFFVVRFPP